MRVLKKTGLLAILLLTALFASFAVTGNVAYAEEPPKISDHVYDPANRQQLELDGAAKIGRPPGLLYALDSR